MEDVPTPSISTPIEIRQLQRSSISGSSAAFLINVSPFAKTAAIIAFSVAPTETSGKTILFPIN